MKISLRKQIVISFCAAFMIIIALFGGGLYGYNSYHYPRQSFEYCKKIVKANITLIDHYFAQLKNISGIVAGDADIVSAVSYRNKTEEVDYSIELYNQRRVASKIKQLDVLSDITNAVIIGRSGQYLYYYGASPVRGYQFRDQEWYRRVTEGNGLQAAFTNFHGTDYLLNASAGRTVSIITPIRDANQYVLMEPSYLLCDFRLEPIISEKDQDSNTQIAVYDGTTPVYFPEKCRLAEEQKGELERLLGGTEASFTVSKCAENPVSYLVVREQSAISGWSILGIMPMTQLEEIQRTNGMFVIAMVLFACLVVFLVSSRISKSLLGPMNQLIGSLNRIAEGNRDVVLLPTRSVEINRISETVGNMLEKIDLLTGRLLTEQKRLSEEQLKALQHQINPHFLNNVLQTIKAMAVCKDTDSISRISTLLGKLLSYSVYNPYDLVPLADELAYTENYIALQNVRWEGKIQYSVDCEGEAMMISVPKLMIQPIVENAIEHGFEHHEGGRITISVEAEETEYHIAVTNSGRAMDPEWVAELNEYLDRGDSYKKDKSIGLLNVSQRLKSCFGREAGIKLFSREGMNTSIIIIIPKEVG